MSANKPARQKEEEKTFAAAPDHAGARLDAFIAALMPPHVSRSRIKELIKKGQVQLDGIPIDKPNFRLRGSEKINLIVPEPDEAIPVPEAIGLDILYEDEALVVVNKPAGMVVHPAAGNWTGTLVNALLYHCGASLSGIGGVKRPGIVHRLDKDTSGVMVVAKTEEALAGLAVQFADHGRSLPLERAYLALCWGWPKQDKGTIDAHLGRSPKNRLKRAIVKPEAPDARHAVTHYAIKQRFFCPLENGGSDQGQQIGLLECRLETGRTHQIRVHMAHIGHPLIGDPDYGSHMQTKTGRLKKEIAKTFKAFRRQALHAAILGFEHPVSKKQMRFEAPLPSDFSDLLKDLTKM